MQEQKTKKTDCFCYVTTNYTEISESRNQGPFFVCLFVFIKAPLDDPVDSQFEARYSSNDIAQYSGARPKKKKNSTSRWKAHGGGDFTEPRSFGHGGTSTLMMMAAGPLGARGCEHIGRDC